MYTNTTKWKTKSSMFSPWSRTWNS